MDQDYEHTDSPQDEQAYYADQAEAYFCETLEARIQHLETELEQVTAERDRLRELLERAVDHVGFYDPDTPTGDLVLEIERALEGGEG